MTPELASKLKQLAQKYEISSFVDADPSQFLRWYGILNYCSQPVDKISFAESSPSTEFAKVVVDTEVAAFIAAMLSFGSRSQFIPKIRGILELADSTMVAAGQRGSISAWLISGEYKSSFPTGSQKFYRFYSYDDMHTFFGEIVHILNSSASLGDFFKTAWFSSTHIPLDQLIGQHFPASAIVPKGKTSANKRIHMFLRWMVRQNSPVDLGLWNWYSPSNLLIPLDVHVMQESVKLGLLPEKATATRKTAVALTTQFKQIWPEDPCRGDFALFGLGVDD